MSLHTFVSNKLSLVSNAAVSWTSKGIKAIKTNHPSRQYESYWYTSSI